MMNLKETYKSWRETMEKLIEDGELGSTDCGEVSVREDFSNYAELEEEISFDEMLELEREYEAKNNNKKDLPK